jgi:Zn-dependent protease
MGVGLSVVLFYSYSLEILVILAIVFTLSFLLHELAHKISAQRLGLWAEFRLTMFGALITVLSMLIPFFKIISPGAMMIAGPVTRENEGKTALSGPLTNIVLSAVFSMIAVATPNPMRTIAGFGAWINAFIAIFNLIPFGIMDGLKVFGWNKAAWAIAFTVSLVLTVLTLSTHWF